MYALINQMGSSSDTPGMIISTHRTAEAAEKADNKLQRQIRSGCRSSYLPTAIHKLNKRRPVGYYPAWTDIDIIE